MPLCLRPAPWASSAAPWATHVSSSWRCGRDSNRGIRSLMRYLYFLAAALSSVAAAAQVSTSTCNVMSYGAKGDHRTNDAGAIQKAIDACAGSGGGTVYFPAGNFLSGTIILKSNVTLE